MFEEQTQKLYDSLFDRLNNLFSKKPFLVTLMISAVVSVSVFLISSDFNRGEAKINVSKEGGEVVLSVEDAGDAKSTEIKIDLAGAINKPGVYVLSAGSRLQDALALGGGFVHEVSSLWVSKNLNLAQYITDGEKIYIPFEWDVVGLIGEDRVKVLNIGVISESKQAKAVAKVIGQVTGSTGTGQDSQSSASASRDDSYSSSSSGEDASQSSINNLVNINTAISADLDKLPGIGPAFAGRVVENRPYADFAEFKEKSGLSANLAESLKDLISF